MSDTYDPNSGDYDEEAPATGPDPEAELAVDPADLDDSGALDDLDDMDEDD